MTQPYPNATDYWRWEGKLWYVAMTRRLPSPEGNYEPGRVTLRDPKGRGPDVSKYDFIAEEKEILVSDLREKGELVWTTYPKDELTEELVLSAENLRALVRTAHSVRVLSADLEGASDRIARDLALALETGADAVLRVLAVLHKLVIRERQAEREAAHRVLNDELRIANCDHFVPEEGCAECAKERG